MKTQLLGTSSLRVTRLSYGCMRLTGGVWDRDKVGPEQIKNGIAAVEAAYDAGYTFFDNADIYGDTKCEEILGQALQLHPGWRENLVVVTKCGIRLADKPAPGIPHRYDFSGEHIVASAEASLKRMQLDTIDLLLLHRPDFLADPAEIAAAFTALRQAGKVREFGVSNFRPSLLAAVQSALPFALQANQVEIHPLRLDCFTDGTLDQCLERRVTPMAWSPIAGGKVGAGATVPADAPDRERRANLLAVLDREAEALGTDRTNVALAWLLRHPSGIVPVIGTANPERIRSMAKADAIELSREAWYRILLAARGEKLP
jgi:predicted oxidoreductase